ncbi:MAG: flagellar hook-length control protein [Planctomycetota bacterium]|nr:MAG: flagellar hook-length control protein [Planctomycetota bacterium]
MQTQSIAGLRQPDQAPPSRDDRPASMEFSALLGSLFVAFPAGQAPEVVRNAGLQDRPVAGREVVDAVRPDETPARQVGERSQAEADASTDGRGARSANAEAAADSSPRTGREPEPRAPDSRQSPSTRPAEVSSSPAGTVRSAPDAASLAPAPGSVFIAASSSVGSVAPARPAAGLLVPPVEPFVVSASQGPETAPGTSGELAPVTDVPATAGFAVAVPNSPALPASAANPVVKAGDASVSAATPATADSQPSAVPASGQQSGPAAPVLRSAQPSGPLSPSSVDRVAAAVKAQASLGGGRVKILLHPPHLGALRIEVAVRDGVVFARMEADSQSARHSLQQHSNDLRQSLEDQGLTLGRMSVSVSQGEGNGSEGSFASNPGPFFADVEPEVVSDSRPEARLSRLLDVTV